MHLIVGFPLHIREIWVFLRSRTRTWKSFEDLQTVYDVVQHTIRTIYPLYYPVEVVDFFCEHHNMEAIAKDIKNGYVSILKIDENIVATGCFVDNHITRVYVLPGYQKRVTAHLL